MNSSEKLHFRFPPGGLYNRLLLYGQARILSDIWGGATFSNWNPVRVSDFKYWHDISENKIEEVENKNSIDFGKQI